MIHIGKYAIGKIDWDSDFTYGHRVEFESIFSAEDTSEYRKMCLAFKAMYGFTHRLLPMRLRAKVFDKLIRGFKGWIDKEQQMLDYSPTEEEKRAGIKELSEKVGQMSTIKALAKAYSADPDEVLEWPYSKVFIILYTDCEERKYEKKLSKEYERTRNKHR